MIDPRRADASRVFARFLKPPKANAGERERWKIEPMPGTVYLVCTSAGEVGIDISADHMVCDLSTFESMAQRFGRVNRYGQGDARIDVVYPEKFDETDKLTPAREATLRLLQQLQQWGGDASPKALLDLRQRPDLPCNIEDAFAPEPTSLPATDILFDSWALTTIRGKLPGRPPVEPYLHGVAEWEPPETYVAWREEVGLVTDALLEQHKPEDLLEDYPLKPHELLRDRSDRVFRHLVAIAQRHGDNRVWLVDEIGRVEVLGLRELADKDNKNRITYRTVLLAPSVGGLREGLLDGTSQVANDVADEWFANEEKSVRHRVRVWDEDPVPAGMRLIRTIDTRPDAEETEEESQTPVRRYWHWYELSEAGETEGSQSASRPVRWEDHTKDVVRIAQAIGDRLKLSEDLKTALSLAAKFHDLGKKRELWQRSIGNPNPSNWYAKAGRDPKIGRFWRPVEITTYRHEFGSLLDVKTDPEFHELTDDLKDVVLHLIAAGHGRARPHFPPDEAFDPQHTQREAEVAAAEVPRRFARLQRKYGRWGLAYLESLLRAADYAASANPSMSAEDTSAQREASS